MTDLLHRFVDHVTQQRLLPAGSRPLLAVSGGLDSTVLLDLMVRAADHLSVSVRVGHVDHGILSDSADVAEQVLGMCWRYGVPGYLERLELGENATETTARRHRYEALRRLAIQADATHLVTAHHADDQVETVVFRLLRGSGPIGLSGMAPRSASELVRPLLPFPKRDLEQWVADGKLLCPTRPHVDPSNRDPRHDRAWIRTVLLPMLRDRFGNAVDHRLLDVARHAAADRAAWSEVLRALPALGLQPVPGGVAFDRTFLDGSDATLAVALFRAAARDVGCVVGPRRAHRVWRLAASAPSGRTFELGEGWVAETAFDQLRIVRHTETSVPIRGTTLDWGTNDVGEARWGNWLIHWTVDSAGPLQRESQTTWLTPGRGRIRAPEPGDKMLPLGGRGRRKVSRLLMEGKIPRSARPTYPVLVRDGVVVWLPGVCRADVEKPSEGEVAIRIHAHVV